jgi:hypothetical protein
MERDDGQSNHHPITSSCSIFFCPQPISALPVQVKRRSTHTPSKNPQQQEDTPSPQLPSIPVPEPSRHGLLHTFLRAVRTHDAESSLTSAEPEKPARPKVDMLQVSVLISMPSVNRPGNCSTSSLGKADEDEEDEETIPEVVFGVTRLPYKPPPEQLTTA